MNAKNQIPVMLTFEDEMINIYKLTGEYITSFSDMGEAFDWMDEKGYFQSTQEIEN